MIVFAKGGHYAMEDLAETEYDVISLDWTMDSIQAKVIAKKYNKTLQGNLDPANLYASVNDIKRSVKNMLQKFGTTGYIANLGHGMYPDMDPDHLSAFVEAIHEYSEKKS